MWRRHSPTTRQRGSNSKRASCARWPLPRVQGLHRCPMCRLLLNPAIRITRSRSGLAWSRQRRRRRKPSPSWPTGLPPRCRCPRSKVSLRLWASIWLEHAARNSPPTFEISMRSTAASFARRILEQSNPGDVRRELLVTMTDTASSTDLECTRTARARGPLVWLDMDQEALDDAYDQAVYAPNYALVLARRVANGARARAALGDPLRLAYGAAEMEGLDVYRTTCANAPINVFIHGGTWRNGRSADFTYLAELFVNAGAHCVILDFSNIDDVGGNLMVLAKQVRSAVAFVYRNVQHFDGDRNRIYVSGHSSGGHLAGCVVTTDWSKEFGLPKDVVKGALLASGMYDLEPVRLSKRSKYVMFTDE